jgi:hypothetical protein
MMSSQYTPFSLHEYLSGMLSESIQVIENPSAQTASVDLKTKQITIPALDYSKPITSEAYRITKAYVDHESAHILYTPRFEGDLGHFPAKLRYLINLMEDCRIERLYSKEYRGIAQDLAHLNKMLFADALSQKIGTDSLQTMISLMFASLFRIPLPAEKHFNPKTIEAYDKRIRPIVERFAASDGQDPEPPAQKVYDTLKELYGIVELPTVTVTVVSRRGGDPCKPTEQNPSEPQDAETAAPQDDAFDAVLEALLQNLDAGQYLQGELELVTPPPDDNRDTLTFYCDRIIFLPPEQAFPGLPSAGIYDKTVKTFAHLIESYRQLFSSTLFSMSKKQTVSTFYGRFNARRVAQTLTSFNPRVFTVTRQKPTLTYDVSVLVDSSGSMKGKQFTTAVQAMIVLAKALIGIRNVTLEVLGFTADSYLDLSYRKVLPCCPDNVVYVLKSFSQTDVGGIPFYHKLANHYDLLHNNFDLAAIKVASARLLAQTTGNRKLLIVLSDGQPSCHATSSAKVLKRYVEYISCKHPIFGIGIDNPSISKIYPRSVDVKDMSTFGTEVLTTIRKFLLKDVLTD